MALDPSQAPAPTPINPEAAADIALPQTNGHEALQRTVALKRVMPVHTKRVELKGEDNEYEGWWAEVRTNPRQSTIEKLSDPVQTYDGLHELLVKHNFVDEEGNDIPNTREGTGMIPVDLGLLVIAEWNEVRRLPPANAGK